MLAQLPQLLQFISLLLHLGFLTRGEVLELGDLGRAFSLLGGSFVGLRLECLLQFQVLGTGGFAAFDLLGGPRHLLTHVREAGCNVG